MSIGLANRPQQKVGVDDGASRYDADGKLWVKHNAEWMTYVRYSATRYLERNGMTFPAGHRVELIDSRKAPVPSNIALKPRGKARVQLTEWVREVKASTSG